jgi:hypothetical protein
MQPKENEKNTEQKQRKFQGPSWKNPELDDRNKSKHKNKGPKTKTCTVNNDMNNVF